MKDKKKWLAKNETLKVSSNTIIKSDGFSKIFFRNDGDDPVTLLGNITLSVYGTNPDNNTFAFIELPDVELKDDYDIRFAGTGANPIVTIVKTYYNAQ